VRGDEAGLRKVLINLIGNGIKYTDAGGVTVAVSIEGSARYRFSVTDTGVGIPAESMAEVFEPFVQGESGLSRGGSGLGLSIARRHVAIMGGELTAESTVGRGSSFVFTLEMPATSPLASPESDRVSTAASFDQADSSIEIPADLLARLLHSADMGSVTEIKLCLADLEHSGDAPAAFAERVRELLKRFDMDGINRLLGSGAVQSRINRPNLATATGELS